MTKIATGYVALRADVDDLKKDLAKAQSQLERSTQTMQGQAVKTGKSFKAMWLAYAAGAAVVAAGAMKAIKAASDLQETTNKFDVVFKNQIKLAESWSRALVTGYAMSTRESKQHLSSIQDLLVPMGMASAAAGKMSFEVVKLSADLASFNNLPTEQVMLDIQSALVGNFETMKKYGVILNVAVVTQKAMEMGLAATKKELTAAHKAQAAYQIMVEGSAAAIGDSARSIGSYARTVKEASAAWEDFQATLGKTLLPAATAVLAAVSSWLKDFLFVLQELQKIRDEIQGKEPPKRQKIRDKIPGAGDAGEAAGEEAEKQKQMQADIIANRYFMWQEEFEAEMALYIAHSNEMIEAEKAAQEQGLILHEGMLVRTSELDQAYLKQQEAVKEAELAALSAQIAKKQQMEERASKAKQKLALIEGKSQLNIMSNTFLMMSTMSGKYNKLFFRMYQATAIANATIAGVEAAVHAWNAGMKYGYPVAVAFTAASIAFTGAQIAAIASQSMPQAPSGVGVSAVGPGAGSTIPGVEPGRPEDEEERGRVNIIIEGDVLADELYIEMLAEKISEAVEGNEVRLIASETRAT